MDYRPSVERAIRFICDHLDRPLTVAEVARAAHLSEFHFHRIFAAVMGEPIGRFATRKRLELSALRLAYEPRRSITDIALSSGYSSSSNFTKAFTAHFGCSPSAVRRPRTSLPTAVGEPLERARRMNASRLDPAALYAVPPDAGERARREEYAALAAVVRIEEHDEMPMAGLACPEGYDFESLHRTWEELIDKARALGLAKDEVDAWGLSFDSPHVTRPELCRYHACVPCPRGAALPPPLFTTSIPRGRYAVFPYAGEVAGIYGVYRGIYSAWLPESGLSPDDFVAIDHYVDDWPVGGRIQMEIRIKVSSPALGAAR